MFTLKDFLELDIMTDAVVLNEPFDFSNLKVSYISVQEPPVEGFVRENEIVLSTTIALEDERSLLKFVQDVYDSHAAAMIFSFVPNSTVQMSQDIIDFADAHRFPLIEIPWNLRFSNVIEVVMNELKEIESHRESKYIKLQEKLLQLYFLNESLDNVASLIAATTNHSIKILDKAKKVKGSYLFEETDRFAEVRIEVNGYLYGYLCISLDPGKKEEPIDVSFLHYYIKVPLSLWFEKEKVINMTGLKIRNDYVWKLAIDKNDSQEIVSQGTQLGFNMNVPYFCVLLRINSQHQDADTYDPETITKIEKKILSLMKQKDIAILLSLKNNRFILFLEDQSDIDVDDLLDEIERQILSLDPNSTFNWGIAERPQGETNFPEQYRTAKIALEQSIDLHISRLNFKQSRITSLINQMTPQHKVRQQALNLLDPILSNDRFNENGMDLLTTITTYLKTNLNTSETSRQLNIHRQSLLYRFTKFEELTELSLDSSDDLFLLQYYLRVLTKF